MSAGKSFSGGFFGCFGVLAAFVLVIFGFTMCTAIVGSGTSNRADEDQEPDYETYEFASHCVNGLSIAAERGLVDPDKSALAMPWSIHRVGGTKMRPHLRCAVSEGDKLLALTIRVDCPNSDEASCTQFSGLEADPSSVAE